jgi:hypothetical protein
VPFGRQPFAHRPAHQLLVVHDQDSRKGHGREV